MTDQLNHLSAFKTQHTARLQMHQDYLSIIDMGGSKEIGKYVNKDDMKETRVCTEACRFYY